MDEMKPKEKAIAEVLAWFDFDQCAKIYKAGLFPTVDKNHKYIDFASKEEDEVNGELKEEVIERLITCVDRCEKEDCCYELFGHWAIKVERDNENGYAIKLYCNVSDWDTEDWK